VVFTRFDVIGAVLTDSAAADKLKETTISDNPGGEAAAPAEAAAPEKPKKESKDKKKKTVGIA
jgi:hypothetical protein